MNFLNKKLVLSGLVICTGFACQAMDNQEKENAEEGSFFGNAFNYVSPVDEEGNILKGKLAAELGVLSLGAGVIAYKYNDTFRELVNQGATVVKDQAQSVIEDKRKMALVGGTVVVGTGALVVAYKYDALGAVKGYFAADENESL